MGRDIHCVDTERFGDLGRFDQAALVDPAGVGAELAGSSGPPGMPLQPASARKAVAPSTVRATVPVRERVDTQVYLTMLFTKLLGKAR
jgi:hypothetical protein